ncbi:MAG: 30S ribosomal protein S12 methylthiotransferase RimO [Clostridium sp.]|nr:30S ribosomal protein S12 methylthiotransferase RimO [Clostridium sp.]
MKKNYKIALINHGCAKNLVDSELMLGMLASEGFSITLNDEDADIVIVNTCSFIHDAEKESVRSILDVVEAGKKLIITGCLPQKHKEELKKAVPEAVAMLGTTELEKIVEAVKEAAKDEPEYFCKIDENPVYIYPEKAQRQQITVGSSSYIKIAEGCNYKCGYCVIPQLRGPYRSRPVEKIVQEAKMLGEKGVSEIVLIAQDTTGYGVDLYENYKKPSLAKLLRELNKVESINWIRVMYTYPSMFDDELISAFSECEKVVKYVDIPLQHSHPEMLKAMRRPVMDYRAFLKKLRERIPQIAVRTTFIVGYPGETDEMFEDLYEFVKDAKFDKMGAFEFSKEKNTYAYSLPEQIPARIKKQRRNKLMKLQQKISKEINETFVGKEIPCIIESVTDDGVVVARGYRDAPEVDGLVYIDTDEVLVPGDIENVKICGCDEYDLYGTV